MGRTSLILLVAAVVSIAAVYLCGVKSEESEGQRKEQENRESSFTVYHGNPPQWNWWDAGTFGFLIIGGPARLLPSGSERPDFHELTEDSFRNLLLMPSKYDTNPLDPDFPEKAKAAAANGERTQTLPYSGLGTQQFPPTVEAEEQTRRFAGVNTGPYGAPYTGQYVPANFTAGGSAVADNKRKIAKIGLPENVCVAAPYLPFSIGLVAGLLELLFVPRHETKVRFHAAQGLAAHVGILAVTTVLGILGEVARGAEVGNGIFTAIATVMLIIFTVKAWKGKPVHIAPIEGLTNWLEEKIYITPKN